MGTIIKKAQIDFEHDHDEDYADIAHAHGNVSNDGKIGSTTDQVVVTGAAGALTTASRSGIDSRSTFPPATHNHDSTYLALSGGTMANTNKVTNLNADLLDGLDGAIFARVDQWAGIQSAYILDGTDDFVTSVFTQSTQSVEMLVYPTATNKALCTFGTNMGITFNSSNVIQYGASFANVTTYINGVAGTTLTLNKWNHIVAVFDAITPTVLEVGRSGSTYFTGRVWGFRPYNRPLTAAEVTQRWNNGAPHLYRLEFADRGSGVKYNSDFSATTDGWVASAGTIAANIDGIGGGNDWLRFTLDNANTPHRVSRVFGIKGGETYQVNFDYYIPSTNSVVTGISVWGNTAATKLISETILNVKDALTSGSVIFTALSDIIYFYANNGGNVLDIGGDDVFYIKNIKLTKIGCTAELLPENSGTNGGIETMNGLHWSTSGNPIAPQPLRDYRATVSTTPVALTNTQKAQTILVRVILKNNNENTQTCSLGTSSGGTQLINAQSVAGNSEVVVSVNSYSATERTLYAVASAASFSITLIYEKVAL